MKESGYAYRAPESDSVAEAIIQDATKKAKKATAPVATSKPNDTVWTQDQQKQLENAIVQYTKSTAGDRWQKIANAVPGKTKEECLARYKYLVEMVKAQKAAAAAAAEETSKVETAVENSLTNSRRSMQPSQLLTKRGQGKRRPCPLSKRAANHEINVKCANNKSITVMMTMMMIRCVVRIIYIRME